MPTRTADRSPACVIPPRTGKIGLVSRSGTIDNTGALRRALVSVGLSDEGAYSVPAMSIRIYVSTDPIVPFDDSWEMVGTIEPRDATTNEQSARKLQKSSSGNASLGVEFYLAGDPASRWVQTDRQHARFGIAFDLLGDGSRVLVANKPAKVAALRERQPEAHPGLFVRPRFLGIKVAGGVKRL